MSSQLEHDYIGLSESPSMEKKTPFLSSSSSSSSSYDEKVHVLNFKETELRLGLPGSDSPERKAGVELRLDSLSPLKNFASGAKRGFSDTINGSQKWGFSVNGGSGLGLDEKISPESSKTQQPCLPETMKVVVPPSPKPVKEKNTQISSANQLGTAPASKAQVVGWPPIRSFRKNNMATNSGKDDKDDKSGSGSLYVKVSMDGAPYLRKVDLKIYSNYMQLSSALKKMFSCFTIGQCSSEGLKGRDGLSESHLKDLLHGSEYVLTYEDKDGDWMLVGDVPWEMFIDLCKKLRIMKGSEAIGLAPRTSEKWKLS